MNQRQKIIAVAIAVPVIGIIAFAATRDSTTPPPAPAIAKPEITAPVVSTPAQPSAPVATATTTAPAATDPGANAKATGKAANRKGKKTLDQAKEEARKRLAVVEALSEDDYAKMRATRANLPATLAQYKQSVRDKENKILSETQAEYDSRKGARDGSARGGKARNTKRERGAGAGKARGNHGGGAGRNRRGGAATDADTDAAADDATPDAAAAPTAETEQ